jgi:hypothetical protein
MKQETRRQTRKRAARDAQRRQPPATSHAKLAKQRTRQRTQTPPRQQRECEQLNAQAKAQKASHPRATKHSRHAWEGREQAPRKTASKIQHLTPQTPRNTKRNAAEQQTERQHRRQHNTPQPPKNQKRQHAPPLKPPAAQSPQATNENPRKQQQKNPQTPPEKRKARRKPRKN